MAIHSIPTSIQMTYGCMAMHCRHLHSDRQLCKIADSLPADKLHKGG